MINVALLMAGLGTRVSSLGPPKPFLRVKEKHLFEMASDSLLSLGEDLNLHAVLSESNWNYAQENGIPLGTDKVTVLRQSTRGPAETARYLEIDNSNPFFTLDCDLKFEVKEFVWPTESDCHLFWYPSNNEAHSFIRTNGDQVVQIAEKYKLSEKGIVGFYGFKSKAFFNELYEATNFGQERFLSKMIGTGIDSHLRITQSRCESHIPLGTLAEIEVFQNEN